MLEYLKIEVQRGENKVKVCFTTDEQERAIYESFNKLSHSFEAFVNTVALKMVDDVEFKNIEGYEKEKIKNLIRGKIKYYLHGINYKTVEHGYFKLIHHNIKEFDKIAEEFEQLLKGEEENV